MRRNKHKQLAFTLIELLVVIAIIGLLASIVLVALNRSRMLGRDAKRKGDLRQIATAVNFYINTNNYAIGEGSGASWGILSSLCPATQINNQLAPNYMSTVPDDPLSPGPPTACAHQDGYWYYYGRKYQAVGNTIVTGSAKMVNFIICSKLENISDPDYRVYQNPWNASWQLNYCIAE